MRILTALIFALIPLPALAQLEVCNGTDVMHRVAIGYQGDKTWTSEGWWDFEPGECAVVVSEPLSRQSYYYKVRAEGHEYGGNFAFCTGDSPFTIFGDTDCVERGFERELFVLEDTGPTATEWTIALTGAPTSAVPPAPKSATAPQPAPGPAMTRLAMLPAPELDYIDYRGAFQPGDYGEQIRVEARFIGCHEDGDQEFCSFDADGVDWLVYPSEANYSETFISMSFLTPGQRVNLSADIVNYYDASIEIAVSQIEAITIADDLDRIYFALQGFFTDPNDPSARAEVIGNTMFELYDNNQVSAYRFSVASNCDGTSATGPALMLSEPETGWASCAILNYVGPDGFDYTEMGMLHGPSYRR